MIYGQVIFTKPKLEKTKDLNNLFSFEASLEIGADKLNEFSKIELSNEHIMLRGTTIRETKEVIGLVVFTGQDMKIILNNKKKANKTIKHSKI